MERKASSPGEQSNSGEGGSGGGGDGVGKRGDNLNCRGELSGELGAELEGEYDRGKGDGVSGPGDILNCRRELSGELGVGLEENMYEQGEKNRQEVDMERGEILVLELGESDWSWLVVSYWPDGFFPLQCSRRMGYARRLQELPRR